MQAHTECTNVLFGLSNHQGETNGLCYIFVGSGESKQTHCYVLGYCNFSYIMHTGTIECKWHQEAKMPAKVICIVAASSSVQASRNFSYVSCPDILML